MGLAGERGDDRRLRLRAGPGRAGRRTGRRRARVVASPSSAAAVGPAGRRGSCVRSRPRSGRRGTPSSESPATGARSGLPITAVPTTMPSASKATADAVAVRVRDQRRLQHAVVVAGRDERLAGSTSRSPTVTRLPSASRVSCDEQVVGVVGDEALGADGCVWNGSRKRCGRKKCCAGVGQLLRRRVGRRRASRRRARTGSTSSRRPRCGRSGPRRRASASVTRVAVDAARPGPGVNASL